MEGVVCGVFDWLGVRERVRGEGGIVWSEVDCVECMKDVPSVKERRVWRLR